MPVASQKIDQNSKQSFNPGCDHCGEPCEDKSIQFEDKSFCCQGCKTVYQILNENDMCRYYELDQEAGISLRGQQQEIYTFLDDPDVTGKLLDYQDDQQSRITFYIPQMHCASCIWLLEKLYKLNDGVIASTVNFIKKEVYIVFNHHDISLRQLVELLANIGYAPAINLSDLGEQQKAVIDRSFSYKLGVAGFSFGNIMLLSFPEYLGLDRATDSYFFQLFGYLNILLALPVVFYSGFQYLQSAWQGLKQRTLNIDVPISIGILTLFGRSVFEILTHSGAGFLDSLAGLVFFLLIGKWFQQRTYRGISFERDYQSYFPIAAKILKDGILQSITLDKLEAGHIIVVKNNELIPADCILLKGEANIDYSFVTGESEPITRKSGDRIFAGGRQIGGPIELNLTKKVSQSYLTQLWNDEAFTKQQKAQSSQLADKVGKFFTIIILLTAFCTLAYWLPRDINIAINAFTAVLIIACPCAVALAIPFIFGNAIRIMGKRNFYLKNTSVIEALSNYQAVVFDKTGTLTHRRQGQISFAGSPLSLEEQKLILAVTKASNHPVSQQITAFLGASIPLLDDELFKLKEWREITGQGVEGVVCQRKIRIGSASFINDLSDDQIRQNEGVYVQMDNEIRGYFLITNHFRKGIWDVGRYLKKRAQLFLLSGDNNREQASLTPIFKTSMHFRQTPAQKLQFIKDLQKEGQKTLMLGDGLNDAGALKQSDAGIVITEDTNNFTPACDAILHAKAFHQLPLFLEFARRSIYLVYGAYAFALIYNIIGLSFAVQGTLSPVIAAILMPLSSISIVLFGVMSSNLLARRLKL